MIYNVWIGGSCDYGHKERAGGAAVIIETEGTTVSQDVIADLNTTEFRMILAMMIKVLEELPQGSDIVFQTNAAYIRNYDRPPTKDSANSDLILRCIELKQRHSSISIKIVPYHKNPLLIKTHEMAHDAMEILRKEYHQTLKSNK